MPQTFHVLRCSTCQVFQVQQVKKVKKWACKMCGQKQSVLRVFGEGTGLECRKHVQQLNMMRGDVERLQGERQSTNEFTVDVPQEGQRQAEGTQETSNLGTKWSQYVEREEEEDDTGGKQETEGSVSHSLCTTDKSVFDHIRKEKRKTWKKERMSASAPYTKSSPSSLAENTSTFPSSHRPFTSNNQQFDSQPTTHLYKPESSKNSHSELPGASHNVPSFATAQNGKPRHNALKLSAVAKSCPKKCSPMVKKTDTEETTNSKWGKFIEEEEEEDLVEEEEDDGENFVGFVVRRDPIFPGDQNVDDELFDDDW